MAAQRFRLQFKFWLDVNKPEEEQLAELVENLKQTGSFTRAIRDGLRLITDLWQGKVEVLLTLFPWVEEYFYDKFRMQQPQSDSALAEQIKRLETLMLQQGNTPIQLPDHGGPKAMNVPQFDPPAFNDDDEDTVVLKRDTTTNSAQNFINSMLNLQ